MTGSFAALLAHVAIAYTTTGSVLGLTCTENAEGTRLGGYFQPGTNQIYICKNADRAYTKRHEIGHYLYFEKMPESERRNWIKLSNTEKVPSAYVSGYAEKDPQEDFAETFEFVVSKKPLDAPRYFLRGYQERMLKINFVKRMIRQYAK